MEGHERWWDAIWRAAAERGDEEVYHFWYIIYDHDILSSFPDALILYTWYNKDVSFSDNGQSHLICIFTLDALPLITALPWSWLTVFDPDLFHLACYPNPWYSIRIFGPPSWSSILNRSPINQVTMTPEHGPPNYQVMRLKIVFQGVMKDIHKLQMKSGLTPITKL